MAKTGSKARRRPTVTVDFAAVVGLLDKLRTKCQKSTSRTVSRSEVLRQLVRIADVNERFATILAEKFK
jgi:hypothetical protein